MDRATKDEPAEVLARLNAALNRHDLAAFVECFDPDYESEQPAHPDRRFRGRAQVERNWAAMFGGLPDFRAEVLRSVYLRHSGRPPAVGAPVHGRRGARARHPGGGRLAGRRPRPGAAGPAGRAAEHRLTGRRSRRGA